jgi:DNA-binding PadR family transcriptional regulator
MGRVPRGDLRLTLIRLLAEHPMHGYEVMSEIETRTGGVWKPSPGSVYPTLSMLQDEGLVSASTDGTRKVFTLTDEGRKVAPDPTTPPPWSAHVSHADPAVGELRSALRSVKVAVEQVMEAGSEGDKDRAKRLLADLRRELYLILAGEAAPPSGESP